MEIIRQAKRDADGRRIEPAVGRCFCGEDVELFGFTNTCSCGREYNWAGAELAPREQWGEETGEYPADIANADGFQGDDDNPFDGRHAHWEY